MYRASSDTPCTCAYSQLLTQKISVHTMSTSLKLKGMSRKHSSNWTLPVINHHVQPELELAANLCRQCKVGQACLCEFSRNPRQRAVPIACNLRVEQSRNPNQSIRVLQRSSGASKDELKVNRKELQFKAWTKGLFYTCRHSPVLAMSCEEVMSRADTSSVQSRQVCRQLERWYSMHSNNIHGRTIA